VTDLAPPDNGKWHTAFGRNGCASKAQIVRARLR